MKLVKFGLLSLVFAITSVWAAEYHGAWITNEVGNWKDGGFTGVATEEWPSGVKYIGEFKDGKYHGRGIKYSASGSIKESGIFKDGKLVTSQYIDPNSFTRIARNNSAPAVTGAQSKRTITLEEAYAGAQSKRTITLEEAYGMPASPAAIPKLTLYEDLYGLPSETGAIPKNQNNLPACVGTEIALWSNCFASYTTSNGDKYEYETKNGKINGQGAISWATGDNYVGQFKDNYFDGQGTFTYSNGNKYMGEWKNSKWNGKGIHTKPDGYRFEGIFEDNRFIRDAKVNLPSLNSNTADNTERNNLELERQRLAEERRKLEAQKAQREQEKKASRIVITATATQPDSSGVVTINIQTNTDTSSLKINGEELGGKPDGSYSVKRVARVGQETKFTIAGVDVNGNTDTKTITVVRQTVDSKAVFGQLNAANVKQQPARDAVAIIIGIEKYKRVAKADFANADAQVFYDYASRALGVKPENIKLLVDDGADDAEIYRAFQNWLPLKVKKGKTEVFVFFSGHGLPSQDGKSLYLLPWGVDKDFVEKTAINQQEIITSLQAVQPKSVTMFLDSCYSGQARGGETLLASARPIALKAEANAYPPNFTVISASAPDQLSSSSPDLKHGIFSYYLMKGMEGDADLNKDSKITIAEIQEYLTELVGRQAMGMNRKQQPQLFGDADKVLIGK